MRLWRLIVDTLEGYVHFAVGQRIVFSENKIPKETDQVLVGCSDSLGEIVIISPDKCVAEEPGMIFKKFVVNVETEIPQVFNGKYGCCAGITLTEGVYLPYSGNKPGNVFDCISRSYSLSDSSVLSSAFAPTVLDSY